MSGLLSINLFILILTSLGHENKKLSCRTKQNKVKGGYSKMGSQNKYRKGNMNRLCWFLLLFGVFGRAYSFSQEKLLARQIFESSGLRGGLVIHLGCEDGKLTAELTGEGNFLVHAISPDQKSVVKARQYLHSKGVYGQAAVVCHGLTRLPYATNLANLVVIDNLPKLLKAGLNLKEVMRVVCPDGWE
jgi:hypothetical protein